MKLYIYTVYNYTAGFQRSRNDGTTRKQGRTQEFALGVRPLSPLLRSRVPLIPARGLGSAVSSPSGFRGRAPTENEFGAL